MLKRSILNRVPYVTDCHALYHGHFQPTVKLPTDPMRPSLGKGRSAKAACASSASEPAAKQKHTLVLDIDETLIHTFRDTSGDKAALSIKEHPRGFEDVAQLSYAADNSKTPNLKAFLQGTSYFKFWTRPYLQEFLVEASELFEVVFWTAGTAPYMAAIINALERQVLQGYLAGKTDGEEVTASEISENTSYLFDFRKNALDIAHNVEGYGQKANTHPYMNYFGYSRGQTLGDNYLKHIPLLGRNPDSVIMMDDALRSFVFTPRSAILVDQFVTKNDNDTFLRDIMPMLRAVAKADSACRELDHWRHDDYHKFDNLDEVMMKSARAHPGDKLQNDMLHLGSFLKERRGCGTPISEAKLFGERYLKDVLPQVNAEVQHMQGQHIDTAHGFMHLFR